MKGYQILQTKLSPLIRFLQKGSISEKDLEVIIPYIKEITLMSSLMYKQKIKGFQRVTVNPWLFGGDNKRIEEIKFLKYPPSDLVKKYGRANLPKQSVLYGTFDYITALSEMRPKIGDRITVSYWKLKTDYDLYVTPIFKNSTKDGAVHNEVSMRARLLYNNMLKQYDENTKKQLEIIIQFIADCFSKEVNDTNHFDYYLSAHYADRFLYEFENGEVDAILYPSVRQSLTLSNIAIKPEVFDDNYEIIKVEENIITHRPKPFANGWSMNATGQTTQIENDKIIW